MQARFPAGRWRRFAALAGVWLWAAAQARAGAPTEIGLSSNSVMENPPVDTVVGALSATDPDANDFFWFSLVAGDGADYNHAFAISGSQLSLRKGAGVDYESGVMSLSIRVRVTDLAGLWFERAFAIQVTDDRTEDTDRDGLSEMVEEDVHGTSDVLFDSDGDGVGDGREVSAGTSPTDASQWPEVSVVGWGKSNEGELAAPEGSGLLMAVSTGQNHNLGLTSAGTVVAWGGGNTYGQHDVPADLGPVIAVAAGGDYWVDDTAFSLALKSDGTVAMWGYDHGGKIVAPAGLDQVTAISAGMTHCLALRNDGTVAAWGEDPFGRLDPPAGLSGVIAVSAGGSHSLALKNDGTVVAWGSTFDGTQWLETSAPEGLNEVVAIAAGRFHDVALKADGTVVAWGFNAYGQANPPPGLAGVVAIAAGGFHNLALKSDGTVVAWGLNSHGQTNVPVTARNGVKWISAGACHSIALRQSEGFPAITSSPVIAGMPGAAIAHQIVVANALPSVFSAVGLPPGFSVDPSSGLVSGAAASAVRQPVLFRVETEHGLLVQYAWIGISTGSPPASVTLSPSAVVENSPSGTAIGTLSATDPDVGDSHAFALVDGEGAADHASFRIEGNQLIVRQTIGRDFEQNPAGFSIRVRATDTTLNSREEIIGLQFLDDRTEDADGDGLSEAAEEDVYQTSDTKRDSDGDGFGDGFEATRGTAPANAGSAPTGRMLVAWGDRTSGQTDPPAGLEDAIDLAAGSGHGIALRENGAVVAWGLDSDGQATVPQGLSGVVAVAAGDLHSLALKSDGTVVAWGNNVLGQTSVPADLSGVVAVAAGGYHNLALKADGTVVAWGFDVYGQTAVPAGLSHVVAVAAGGFHSLALRDDGTVVAWGSNWADVSTVPAGLSGVVDLAAGGYHSLALRYDGSVIGWGENGCGQAQVPDSAANVAAITAGWLHSLALTADGSLLAWGNGSSGQTDIPMEARHVHKIAAGDSHNLALRQDAGFPKLVNPSPVRAWPGETVTQPATLQNAVPAAFSTMGLPSGLAIHPATGLVSGTVASGERRSVRLTAETDRGRISQVVWFNTADGLPPSDIALSGGIVAENAPAGTVVGTLSVVDSNAGDSHTFDLAYEIDAPDSFRFLVSGNQLVLRYDLSADYDIGKTSLAIRVIAVDSGNNALKKDFVVQLTDDRLEDADGDGLSEMTEEDVFGTSDLKFDDFAAADPDSDGVPSLLEHAFNLDPLTPGPPLRLVPGGGSTAGLPAVTLADAGGGQFRLRVEYLRRVGGGMIYSPQFASGLNPESWAPAANPVVVTPIDAQWERCVVEDSLSIVESPRRFGRVAVLYSASDRMGDADGDGINRAMEEEIFGSSDSHFDDFATADLDGDGVPSMIEHAFNLDPLTPGPPLRLVPGGGSSAGLPTVTLADAGGGQFRLRVEYVRRVGGGMIYTPQFSSGLNPEDWTPAANPVVVTPIDAQWERCVVEDTAVSSDAVRRFARVGVKW